MEAVAEYLTAPGIDFKVRIFYLIVSDSQLFYCVGMKNAVAPCYKKVQNGVVSNLKRL